MSDSFAICPKCGCFDASIGVVDKSVDENDEEQEVECNECGERFKMKDILWNHVEYGVD